MENSKGTIDHLTSNLLFGVGAVCMFLGFVFPGWDWLLNTPGDVEMLTLAAASVVGVIGAVLFVAAIVKLILENRHASSMEKDSSALRSEEK